MHTIITCTAPNLVGAGRQPLSAIHNLPDNYSKTIRIDSADNATGCLRVQVVEDTPVAMSPVPPTLKRVRTINKLEGLAMLERRKAHLAQEEIDDSLPLAGLAHASSLERVRTVNKLEGLGMLERRHNLLAEQESRIDSADNATGCLRVQVVEDTPVAMSPVPPTLKRVKTINKLEGLAMLERRKAHLAQEEIDDSLPLAGLAHASSLKRVRTVNKLEGLGMLERRHNLLAEQESGPLAQASSLKRVRTINRLDGLSKLERRKARIAGEDFTIAFPLTGAVYASSLKRVRTITKSTGLKILERNTARFYAKASGFAMAEVEHAGP